MAAEQAARLAVLMDADNAPASKAGGLLAEVATYGTAHVKCAYGDLTGPALKGWKEVLLDHSIQPMQQFAYTSGKNATDAALIIDAMDLLCTGRFDGFCLVSSDSDFTRLAGRIRESGLTVYGFGERKTPKPFVAACDEFIYPDNLTAAPPTAAAPSAQARARQSAPPTQLRADTALAELPDGWTAMRHVSAFWPSLDAQTRQEG